MKTFILRPETSAAYFFRVVPGRACQPILMFYEKTLMLPTVDIYLGGGSEKGNGKDEVFMEIDRRAFLATITLGGAAAVVGAQTRNNQQTEAPVKTNKSRVVTRLLKDAGTIPNSYLPVLIYQGALDLPKDDPASAIEALIHANDWGNDWRNGVFTYHHYHSTAHEALLVFGGSAKVQLGGESGVIETIGAGDVIVIPAGVGHKNLGSSEDFHVVGAYPPRQNVDMNYGKAGERPRVDENIARLALPTTDPVFGKTGPLLDHWLAKNSGG